MGGTFIATKYSLSLENETKKGITLTISIKDSKGSSQNIHYSPKWPMSVFFVHVADFYGCPFPCFPNSSVDHKIDT